MTTQDMTAMSDILDCFRYFAGVGLKSVPHTEDADVWLRVLSDVPASLLHLAADEWIRTPVKDKGGTLRGQKWAPTAGELRNLAFALEADHRVQVTNKKRGCASCGEVLDEHGAIAEHGSGYRTISQHCYPAVDGAVDWQAEPYRVASRDSRPRPSAEGLEADPDLSEGAAGLPAARRPPVPVRLDSGTSPVPAGGHPDVFAVLLASCARGAPRRHRVQPSAAEGRL